MATRLEKAVEKLYHNGRFRDASPLAERCLAPRGELLGPTHPDVAKSRNNLGELYQAQGANPKSESLYIRALDIREKALGPMHPFVAYSLNNLAVLYLVASEGPPGWVPVGEAAPIDAAVDAVLTALQAPLHTEASRAALQHLDALVMTPLRDQLSEVSQLILAPDDQINLVPFEALIDPRCQYELDKRASRRALSGLVGPAILHIATHGFYAQDPGAPIAPGSRGPSAPPPRASTPRAPRGT